MRVEGDARSRSGEHGSAGSGTSEKKVEWVMRT